VNDNLIPTPGAYSLWLTSADDYDVWSLPIIGLVPHLVSYSGEPDEEPNTEYAPAVIDHSGNVHELRDLDGTTPQLFLGGFVVGIAPAALGAEQALAHQVQGAGQSAFTRRGGPYGQPDATGPATGQRRVHVADALATRRMTTVICAAGQPWSRLTAPVNTVSGPPQVGTEPHTGRPHMAPRDPWRDALPLHPME
jgi:hypothetical protein